MDEFSQYAGVPFRHVDIAVPEVDNLLILIFIVIIYVFNLFSFQLLF